MAKLKRFSGTPVSEGIRLEVSQYTVFAVRNTKGDIAVRMRREPRKLLRTCMHIPFLRGVTRLLRDIIRFFDGLGETAELKPNRPERGNIVERGLARFLKIHPQTIAAWISALLIPIIGFLFLYAAPEGVELFLQDRYTFTRGQLSAIVCAVRIVGVLMSIGVTCRLRVIRRLCMYKGALNKVINCYECRDEISVKNAAGYPVHTRRSEPLFLMGVLVISMVIFPMVYVPNLLLTALVRILIVLGVAAVFNEPYRALEDAELTLPVRITRAPLNLMQHITVLEPQNQMLEVAVCAFQAVLEESDKEVKTR